jgi:hypothetical protein
MKSNPTQNKIIFLGFAHFLLGLVLAVPVLKCPQISLVLDKPGLRMTLFPQKAWFYSKTWSTMVKKTAEKCSTA